MPILEFLDYAGVAIFAATGALSASRKQLDIIGYLFLASATGIGGGTIRDLVLGATPVFWVVNPNFIIVCAAVAVAVFLTSHLLESRYRMLVWLDALGLSAYCVMGAAKGLAATGSPIVAWSRRPDGNLRRGSARSAGRRALCPPEAGDLVSAALIGAGAFVLASLAGLPLVATSALGVITAFAVRGGALRYGWTLPTGKAGPGRDPDDVM